MFLSNYILSGILDKCINFIKNNKKCWSSYLTTPTFIIEPIVLRDRQHLAQDGLIVIVLTMDSQTGEVVAGPDVISRGFVYVRESENLMDDVKSVVRHEVAKCEERGVRDWSTIKSTVKENLRDYLFIKTKRNPMIIPIIMEV